jgi:hypothetical protein
VFFSAPVEFWCFVEDFNHDTVTRVFDSSAGSGRDG